MKPIVSDIHKGNSNLINLLLDYIEPQHRLGAKIFQICKGKD
jgi:hypothetical protein